MSTRMQQRRGTAAQWISTNSGNGPILAAGEIGFESDTNKFKIGDGINHWVDLTYFTDIESILGGISGVDLPAALDTLNELAAALGDDSNFASTMTTALGNKQDKVSGVSDTEIGYLDGVTSSIQTQLNSKLSSADLTEAAQDAVNTALVAGTGLDKTYDDASNTITLDIDSTVATKTYADNAVSTHSSDSTDVHGITDTAELATKAFAASLLTGATKSNITITGDKNGLTITAENGVADSTTDNLTEGSTNKYFTDERAQDAVGNALGNGLKYTDSTGVIEPDLATSGGLYIEPGNKLAVDGYYVTFNGAEQTLTNKTLTSPKINEAVALTATATELNTLDGITASTAELNTLDGITSSVTELNILDGATLTTTELNYVDGVTSAIQDQLDDKAPLASPTFTGTATVNDLEIGGALTFSGTATEINQTDLTIEDPLIYLGAGNTANINDLGFIGHFDNGTYQHTGLVRDASDNAWKLFKGVTDEPTNTVNFGQGSLDDLKVSGLTASSITVGDVSNTEFGYLNGVTSAIQTQIDAKAPLASPTFTGTVTLPTGTVTSGMILDGTIANADINASAAIDWTKLAISSTVSATEIGYLDGVTSAIQTQLNAKAPLESPTFTGTVSGITKSMVGLGNVENTALSTWAGSTNITTVGTIATGTWSASTIALNKGGTGATTQAGAANAVLPAQTSASGKYLTSDGTNVSWGTVSSYSAPTLGSTSVASGATVTTIAGLTLSGATLTGSLTANSSAGTSGQVLSSTGTGVQWITPAASGPTVEEIVMGVYA